MALIVLWEALGRAQLWDPTLFPTFTGVLESLRSTIADGSLPLAIGVSLQRVLIGYAISMAVGIPLGILIARVPIIDQSLGTLVAGFQSLPSICWLPIALLWFGLNDTAIIFVIVMGSLVSIAVSVQDGVRNLPPTYARAARTMGTRGIPMVLEVFVPASLPAILTGAKLGWSYAWRALMSGELLFVSIGLGHLLMMGRELADMAQVVAVMIVIIALGVLTDRMIFNQAELRVRRRWGLSGA